MRCGIPHFLPVDDGTIAIYDPANGQIVQVSACRPRTVRRHADRGRGAALFNIWQVVLLSTRFASVQLPVVWW